MKYLIILAFGINKINYHWQSYSQLSRSWYFLMNSIVRRSLQGSLSFGFFFRIAKMNSLNSFDTFLFAGNSTSSVTYINKNILFSWDLPASWCWRATLQRQVQRPELPQPRDQLFHHTSILEEVRAKDRVGFHRMSPWVIIFCWPPIRNHKV